MQVYRVLGVGRDQVVGDEPRQVLLADPPDVRLLLMILAYDRCLSQQRRVPFPPDRFMPCLSSTECFYGGGQSADATCKASTQVASLARALCRLMHLKERVHCRLSYSRKWG